MDENEEPENGGLPDDAKATKPWQRLRQKLKIAREGRQRTDSDAESIPDDISEFLNSGNARPQVPRIDVVAARRFSDTGHTGGEEIYPEDQFQQLKTNAPKKLRRREGLVVTFVTNGPVVIGEGGEDALDPPSEISRLRGHQLLDSKYRQPVFAPGRTALGSNQPLNIARKAIPVGSGASSSSQSGSRPPSAGQERSLGQDVITDFNASHQHPKSGQSFNFQDENHRSPPELSGTSASALPFRQLNPHDNILHPSQSENVRNASLLETEQRDRRHFEYSQGKGLRRMRADEGKALIIASQRNKLLSPKDASTSPPLPTSLQVATARVSLDSDRTSSQHSNASVTTFPGKLADSNDADREPDHNLLSRDEIPEQGEDKPTNPLLNQFADRIAHLKSVFRLSGEVSKHTINHSDIEFTRVALWWFLQSALNIENLVRSRSQSGGSQPMTSEGFSVLMQNYVNLAKSWYLLVDVLKSPSKEHCGDIDEENEKVKRTLIYHFEHLIAFLDREHLMPPGNVLVQGLDTTIWLDYPDVSSSDRNVLAGKSLAGTAHQNLLLLMPLGDSSDAHFYGRSFVKTTLTSKVKALNVPSFPSLVSMLRRKSDRHLSLAVASQTPLVNLFISSNHSGNLTWEQVRWTRDTNGVRINVGHGLRVSLEFMEPDYRLLSSLYDYSCKIISSLQPKDDEVPVLSMNFKEFEYEDSAHPGTFSTRAVQNCHGLLFERFGLRYERLQERRLQWGHRLAVSNGPRLRDLRSVSVGFDQHASVVYEYFTIPEPTMILRLNQRGRTRRLTITFDSEQDATLFRDHLTGQVLGSDEESTDPIPLKSMLIDVTPHSLPGQLPDLQWDTVVVIRQRTPNHSIASLRFRLHHRNGTFIDHLPRTLLPLRLSPSSDDYRQITLLRRRPQESAIVSLGPLPTTGYDLNAVTHLVHGIFSASSTRRNYEFQTLAGLHAFEAAVTGFSVVFDGPVASFSLSDNARRPVLSIHRSQDAATGGATNANARVQILTHLVTGAVQLVAFFPDEEPFLLGPGVLTCLNIEFYSTDVFEVLDEAPDKTAKPKSKLMARIKGDDAASASTPTTGGFGVKLVSAKLVLPATAEPLGREEGSRPQAHDSSRSTGDAAAVAAAGFVCLEADPAPHQQLPSKQERDVVLVFADEKERDAFIHVLPSAALAAAGTMGTATATASRLKKKMGM